MWKKIRNYFIYEFGFNPREIRAFFVLNVLFIACLLGMIAYTYWPKDSPELLADTHRLDSLVRAWQAYDSTAPPSESSKEAYESLNEERRIPISLPIPSQIKIVLLHTTLDTLQALGISNSTSRKLISYTKKGGMVKDSMDLYKIYGISQREVRILSRVVVFDKIRTEKPSNRPTGRYAYANNTHAPIPESKVLNLNTADYAALEALPYIGASLASRIIKYRGKLGGFYSKMQLYEVYGIDTVILREKIWNRVYVDTATIQKRKLVSENYEALSRHPYIGYRIAKLILSYKAQHGQCRLEDLHKFPNWDANKREKAVNYLQLDP